MNSLNHDPPHAHIAPNTRCLNKPPRPRLSKERGHLLDGAATPPWPRRGAAAFPDARQKSPTPSPLLKGGGWTRHKEDIAKPLLKERTGWSLTSHISECV